jgi:hypothetical protein
MSKFKSLLLAAVLLVAGCAPPTRYLSINPVNNEKLSSARVVFEMLPSMPITFEVNRKGPPMSGPDNVALSRKIAMAEITPLLDSVKTYVAPQVRAELEKRGVLSGTDAIIYLRPTTAGASSQTGVTVALEMTVQLSDKTKPHWIATIVDKSSPMDPGSEKIAQKFSTRVIDELVKAGFVSKL